MAKKKSWFSVLKSLFVSEAKTEKRRRKWTFWRLKIKKRLPSITAPSPPLEDRMEFPGEKEQIKPFPANEASFSNNTLESGGQEEKDPDADTKVPLDSQFEDHNCVKNRIEELAAIRIQTAFRGLLARKALCALKGIVKLQAYIRGRAVRRQTMTTLKCLQSVVSIQSQVCARRIQITEDKELQSFKDKIIGVDTNSQRRWDDSLLTKEEVEAMVLNKKEAAIKRERIREYASHRKSAESYRRRPNTRWKYWLDQWVDTQLSKSKELEDLDFSSSQKRRDEIFRDKQMKPRSHSPRKLLHHRKLSSGGEDDHNPFLTSRSPTAALPAYMAATESVKAKARSLSSPKMRPHGNSNAQSESHSPYKNKLCLTTSVMSEARNSVRSSAAYQQRSPSLRGFTNAGPVKSSHNTLKDLSINSECALPTWNRRHTFR